MKNLKFADGQKPITSDLNAIHGFTEDGLKTLLAAIGGTNSKLLFEAYPPVATSDETTLSIAVTSQHFAIDGAIATVASDSVDITIAGNMQVGIFFILSKDPTEELRNFLTLNPDNVLVQQDILTEIYSTDAGRIEYITVSDLISPIPTPALGATDVGYIQLASVSCAIGTPDVVTVVPNSLELYTIPPGAAGAVTVHASSHLPAGNDPIQVSSLSGAETGGSSVGLMPNGALTAAMSAVQEVEVDDLTTFLTISTSGDNEAQTTGDIDSKIVTIGFSYDASLTIRDVGGLPHLGVAFSAAGSANGDTYRAAHSNHKHALIDTGIIYQSFTLDATNFSAFGTIIGPYTVTATQSGGSNLASELGQIIHISTRWIPPNLTGSNGGYAIDTPYTVLAPSGQLPATIGIRAIITAADKFNLEIGELGFAYLSSAVIAQMNTVSNPNWAAGNYANVGGKIQIDVIALRAEAYVAGTSSSTL
jgi:hypothetical protein